MYQDLIRVSELKFKFRMIEDFQYRYCIKVYNGIEPLLEVVYPTSTSE